MSETFIVTYGISVDSEAGDKAYGYHISLNGEKRFTQSNRDFIRWSDLSPSRRGKNLIYNYIESSYKIFDGDDTDKTYKDKPLIIEEFDKFFTIRRNKDESPLILGKSILD